MKKYTHSVKGYYFKDRIKIFHAFHDFNHIIFTL